MFGGSEFKCKSLCKEIPLYRAPFEIIFENIASRVLLL